MIKEVLSDELTIKSPQTSTLTRIQDQIELQTVLANDYGEEEYEKAKNQAATQLILEKYTNSVKGAIATENELDDSGAASMVPVEKADKETNTKCAFLPEKGRRK